MCILYWNALNYKLYHFLNLCFFLSLVLLLPPELDLFEFNVLKVLVVPLKSSPNLVKPNIVRKIFNPGFKTDLLPADDPLQTWRISPACISLLYLDVCLGWIYSYVGLLSPLSSRRLHPHITMLSWSCKLDSGIHKIFVLHHFLDASCGTGSTQFRGHCPCMSSCGAPGLHTFSGTEILLKG
jgi:hypothetical protein